MSRPGGLLGMISEGGGAVLRSAPVAKPAAVAPASGAAPAAAVPPAPSAAKMMADTGVSVDAGSGKRGQVLKGDVIDAIAKGACCCRSQRCARPFPPRRALPRPQDDASREERVRMSKLRQTIARRLKESQNTAATLTTFNEVDMSAVMDLRNRYKDLFEKKHGVKLGFMGFFTKAVTYALKRNSGGQRRDRRHGHHLQKLRPHWRRCRHGKGSCGSGRAQCRQDDDCRSRKGHRPSWQDGA